MNKTEGLKSKFSIEIRELIIDNFAGGGGATSGIEFATGRSPDIAINHDEKAIAMHKANHPSTKHYCENVWEVNPYNAVGENKVGLAWFSPDCKHFSKAKGGKPCDKKIRGLAWVAVKWALFVKPRVIVLENVEEFKTWGPIDDEGKIIKDKKGETFKIFIEALKENGYQVDYKELRACDFGAPTSRKRLFIIARCDGKPIKWPKETHGDPEVIDISNGTLKPWKTAADIIDWSLPCPSIFNRKKDLAENTQRRIARGIKKFVTDNADPFIVRIGQTGFGKDRLQYKLSKPLTTITTKAEHLLITPFIASYHTETNNKHVRGQSLSNPVQTIDTTNRHALVSAFIERQFTNPTGHLLTKPLGTVTAIDKSRLVTAFLIKYYGTDGGQGCDLPLHTITTRDRFGLVTIKGHEYQIVDIGLRMLQPRELFNAHGFSKDYIIDQDYLGNSYPKKEQVARCGNSVPPPFARAIVQWNLPEFCKKDVAV